MRWFSTVSGTPDLDEAVAELTEEIRSRLGERRPDLVVAFVSRHHRERYDRVPSLIQASLDPRCLIGCSGGGVIGAGREIEHRPGVSVTAAILQGVSLAPFRLQMEQQPAPEADRVEWAARLRLETVDDRTHLLLLPDPFSFDIERCLVGLDAAFPAGRKIGGLASGGQQPGGNALFLGEHVYRSGLVGLAMSGLVEVDAVVAQGCRPIGEPLFVTSCSGHFVRELNGKPVVEVLRELHERLGSRDQELFRTSLFLGLAMRESKQQFEQGDFLIRNLLGFDPSSGALAVGAQLKNSQIVQFHLRDARTSAEDLAAMLSSEHSACRDEAPAGALLFSCLGRGIGLYGQPDHDTDAFRHEFGSVPLGGFFCNGEIGPVHGTTYLHGYTSSFALFRSRSI
ncbi:MAG: FIST C-terminal domain-containing protein [Acidobacteriota bacterium]|nr:MAG: FIST C-terminal domain-containing protein [Acidobacteriota bacterium]